MSAPTPVSLLAAAAAWIAVAAAPAASALTISVPLPELLGDFSPHTAIPIAFDTAFAEITDVAIAITGSGTQSNSLIFQVDREGTLPIRLIYGSTPDFSSQPSTQVANLIMTVGTWDFLLDGEGSFSAHWNCCLYLFNDPALQIHPATLRITHAEIRITGVPVPEPGGAGLLGAGLVAIAVARRTSGAAGRSSARAAR